jgi:hypothetical protein
VLQMVTGIDSGSTSDLLDSGFAEAVGRGGVEIVHSVAPLAMASCRQSGSELPVHLRHLSCRPQVLLLPDYRLSAPLSRHDEWDVECISSFFVHIDYKETSCRISFSSSHSCYMQSVFCRLIWVLSLVEAVLLRCSGYGRVRCSDVVEDRYEQVRPCACMVRTKGRARRRGGSDVPPSKTHMACEAFKWLHISIYSSVELARKLNIRSCRISTAKKRWA